MSDPIFDENIESVEVHEELFEGDYEPAEGESVQVLEDDSWSTSAPADTTSPQSNQNSSSSNFDAKPKVASVTAAMREFNEKHEKELSEKQRVSDEKKKKKIEDAKKSLENFYSERESKKKTALKNNRDHNKTLESDNLAASSTKDDSWEAVVAMIDITAKPTTSHYHATATKDKDEKPQQPVTPAKDTSRMKEVLLRLKNTKV